MGLDRDILFGPVPSRRLGLSLGMDLVPAKVCSLDCIYCLVGFTTHKTIERESFFDIDDAVTALAARLETTAPPDFITLSGSGEPTLNADLGRLIDGIKSIATVPVALITNGTLFHLDDVRTEARRADVVLPSLDAANATQFQAINRPATELSFDTYVDGLVAFREGYDGPIWLEIFLLAEINTRPEQLEDFQSLIARIRPDKVHLNTAVRPTAEPDLSPVDPATLAAIAQQLGPTCEVIADFSAAPSPATSESQASDVLALLQRRPCTTEDIAAGLHITEAQANALIGPLLSHGCVRAEARTTGTFYVAVAKG